MLNTLPTRLAGTLRLEQPTNIGPSRRTLPSRRWVTHHTIPRHDSDTQNSCHTAEYQRHDAAGGEAIGQPWWRRGLAGQVEQVDCITGCVACRGDGGRGGGTGGEVVRGDGERLLQLEGCFDDGGCETRGDVPLNVAVEEPDACLRKRC